MASATKSALKRIVIEPVTRVEGHGKVTLLLGKDNKVEQARLSEKNYWKQLTCIQFYDCRQAYSTLRV